MNIKDIIKKFKLYSKTNWDVKDFLIEAKDRIEHQTSPSRNIDIKTYTCFRDRTGFCLYVPMEKVDTILSDKRIYCKDYNLINLSELRRCSTKRDIIGKVYNRITPAVVKLKFIEDIYINNTLVYLVYNTDLTYDDQLYDDLVNYNKIEEEY